MRIDKFLKLTRLVKRRTVAKELANRDLFYINGKIAKPSTEIKVGDVLTLFLGRHKLDVEVKEIFDHCKKEDSNKMYEILKDEIIENEEA